ncbi:hypothetical protein PanWU01x14_191180 [Parasponia andersonii]|uniref:COI1 F-box domain-containing protein n=1 Tax=Parasponia andersonii TaxID=3476 RepID=A0A2P5C1R8_PARAD|nr:hypothetical protein PanWU01x14_191180 [Parasponia andersonii]
MMSYIHNLKDQDAISLVCRHWYKLDALTPKYIVIALYYTATPNRLQSHLGYLESLKLNEKPRASMFNLIPEDWGGYVMPWATAIS